MVQRAVFQSVASMGLPAFTIHSIVRYSGKALKDAKNRTIRTYGPIGVRTFPLPAQLLCHHIIDISLSDLPYSSHNCHVEPQIPELTSTQQTARSSRRSIPPLHLRQTRRNRRRMDFPQSLRDLWRTRRCSAPPPNGQGAGSANGKSVKGLQREGVVEESESGQLAVRYQCKRFFSGGFGTLYSFWYCRSRRTRFFYAYLHCLRIIRHFVYIGICKCYTHISERYIHA